MKSEMIVFSFHVSKVIFCEIDLLFVMPMSLQGFFRLRANEDLLQVETPQVEDALSRPTGDPKIPFINFLLHFTNRKQTIIST